MVPGPTLIDHERVCGLGAAPHEVAAIYRIGAGGIEAVWLSPGA